MKTKLLIILSFLFISVHIFAQHNPDSSQVDDGFDIHGTEHSQEGIGGDFNYARIGEENYFGFRFKPELSIGKLGFGLDVPFMFNLSNGSFKIDEFQGGIGVFRMLRYVSWGVKKRDPFFIRVGELSDAYLGFGILMNEYNNSISYEKRKLGVEFDLVIKKKFGLEFIYSDVDFRSFNLMGIRPYYKPLGATKIPILKTLEIGAGFVFDKDNTSFETDSMLIKNNYYVNDGLSAYNVDMGLYILNFKFMQWRVYTQAAYMPSIKNDALQRHINNLPETHHAKHYAAGNGFSIGSDFRFKILGNLLRMNYRVERIWYSDYFIPHFFDFEYEINKDHKIHTLINTENKAGIFGSVAFSVLNKIIVHGTLMLPDEINDHSPAMLALGLDLSNLHKKLILHATYYKGGITDFSEALKFDDQSLAHVRLAWKIVRVPVIKLELIAGLDYRWTYATTPEGLFEATNYISPYFGINFPLNFEKGTAEEH